MADFILQQWLSSLTRDLNVCKAGIFIVWPFTEGLLTALGYIKDIEVV